MADEKKKTTSTKKSTSSKKTTSTTKKTNTTKKNSSSKPKTATKNSTSSSTSKTRSTSTKKSTSSKKTTTTKAKSTSKKTTNKKATKTPKKSTSTTKKTTVKKEVKPVVNEEKFEYTNSYTLTDIFNNHKKEETRIKPEDVVFEEDKSIEESNLSVEEKLDKVLDESNILDIPEEKEFVVEEPEIKEEVKIDKPIVIEERAFGREERPKKIVKKKKLKNWVYIALILIFILIIGFSIFKIVSYKPLNDQLNEKYVNVLDGGYKEYDIDFNGLKKLNKDTVGYVKVNATNINHVVVKGKDNKYYKNNNFMKKKSKSGWIYMDSRNKLDGTDKNIVIYGSNSKDMFGTLSKVLTDKWQKKKEYHYITYVSDNFEYRYQVFSTYESNDDIKINFNKQIDYANYIQDIRKKSNYDYDVYVGSFDNILTLVSYNGNKQIIVHAKLIK